jgi:5-methylcytosine-specific restriction endonuclease McrBC regulatory subunit McrC
VRVRRRDVRTAEVRVSDAVGMVATPSLELHVAPKVPSAHLLALLRAEGLAPRFDVAPGHLAEDDNLAVLVAHWLVTALERVLEQGLAADYRSEHGELRAIRGRVAPLATTRLFYRGRLAVVADYEEFDYDTSLNRLLRHAARVVAAARPFPPLLRRRALRCVARMDGIGELRTTDPDDLVLGRRTAYCGHAARLAREVIRASGRTLDAGRSRGWAFLLRTPALVEDGVRRLLTDGLAPTPVRKRSVRVSAGMTINPDLVIGDSGSHVADVKYKLGRDEWARPDLYEVVAFAAALRAPAAAIVCFRPAVGEALPEVEVGDYAVRELVWPTSGGPDEAAAALVDQARAWLGRSPSVSSNAPSATRHA